MVILNSVIERFKNKGMRKKRGWQQFYIIIFVLVLFAAFGLIVWFNQKEVAARDSEAKYWKGVASKAYTELLIANTPGNKEGTTILLRKGSRLVNNHPLPPVDYCEHGLVQCPSFNDIGK